MPSATGTDRALDANIKFSGENMSGSPDFMLFVTNEASKNGADDNSTWFVTFADGENRSGTLRLLGGNAYVLSGKVDYYFSSSQVIRLHVTKTD